MSDGMHCVGKFLEFCISIPLRFVAFMAGEWGWAFSRDFFGEWHDKGRK